MANISSYARSTCQVHVAPTGPAAVLRRAVVTHDRIHIARFAEEGASTRLQSEKLWNSPVPTVVVAQTFANSDIRRLVNNVEPIGALMGLLNQRVILAAYVMGQED